MTIRNLEGLFAPGSLAIHGPNAQAAGLPGLIISRLQASGFRGRTALINLEAPDEADSWPIFASIADLTFTPDLLIYLGPAEAAPATIAEAAARGIKAVALQSAGYESWPDATVSAAMQAARSHAVRLIGPGSLGVAAPHSGLNLLATREAPQAGDLALIARSGAVVNSILSWASSRKIGFSGVASLGQRSDVDGGDLIDYFASDYRTRAILLHVEAVSNPRKFLSAARAAARSKPIILIRSGRSRDAAASGNTHAGRLTRADAVYESALRRAGILRIADLDELFEAVETLTRLKVPKCQRLGVIANGRSLATLAADKLQDGRAELAELDGETLASLQPLIRPGTQPGNPLTLPEGAAPEAVEQAVTAMLASTAVDGVLVLAAPNPFVPGEDVARAIANAADKDKRRLGRRKAVVAAMVGEDPLPRAALDFARVPVYGSPAEAVRSILYLKRSAEAQEALMAAPPSLPSDFSPDVEDARAIVTAALKEGRSMLDPAETAALLFAYRVPMIETHLARTIDQVRQMAGSLLERYPACVVKAWSTALPFKSDIDGVRLGIESADAAAQSAQELIDLVARTHPKARIEGFTLQPMLEAKHGLELFAGLGDDPSFGPVIAFGQGGTSVEVSGDVSLELPPLDLNLANQLIRRTRVSRLFQAFRGHPERDMQAVALTLMKLSQITIDLPQVRELDINPLVALPQGVLALDARIVVGEAPVKAGRTGSSRLAIAPYPQEWEQTLTLREGEKVFVRPVRPEDEDLFRAFFEQVSPEDLRLRFFAPVKDFDHRFLSRLTQLDYARAMALAAIDPETGDLLGVVRLHADPDHKTGEYAVMVRSDLKGRGLGWALMKLIIRYAEVDGIDTIKGEVLKENTSMLTMCEDLGFTMSTSPDDPAIALVTLSVKSAAATMDRPG
ncbi:MAG: GNAT family N-acetyltransferase [Polymorphum sp.]|nr:GNAT family N-acetyltransferase [Polymorphum sp.]